MRSLPITNVYSNRRTVARGNLFNWWFAVFLIVSLSTAKAQQVIEVPGDVPTVQAGIDLANNGDTVNIAPGVYAGPVNFQGKSITVQGSGPGVIIKGNQDGPVITFNSGETRSSILQNVTISNGAALGGTSAGGIFINGSSPTIQNSTISGNLQCGIGVNSGAPAILNNEINTTVLGLYIPGCMSAEIPQDPYGGGILLFGTSNDGLQTQIIGNTIENNQVQYGAGGINVISAGLPLIENNVVRSNNTNEIGAGINVIGDTAPLIVQNLIYGNTINPIFITGNTVGAGLSVDVSTGQFGSIPVLIVNNTIVDNHLLLIPSALAQGSQFRTSGQTQRIELFNNLIVGTTSQAPIECVPVAFQPALPPTFVANDVYDLGNPGAVLYSGACTDQTGVSGNISADPLFATEASDPHPYQLLLASPAVDAGDNQAPAIPSLDILGQPRIQNGKGLSTSIIDMGVYEYAGVPAPPPPPANFTLVVSPGSATIQQGQSATFSVAVTPSAANLGAVTLGCSGLPANSACMFNPSVLGFTNTDQQASVLTVTTGSAMASLSRTHRIHERLSITLAGLMLILLRRRHRERLRMFSLVLPLLASGCLVCLTLGLSGCGKDNYIVVIPPHTYSLVVHATAVSSGLSEQAAVSLTVDQ